MSIEECKHGHSAPKEVLDNLEPSQAGTGRHKCAICAYNEGYENGMKEGLRLAKKAIEKIETK
jgi:hypothetical protein